MENRDINFYIDRAKQANSYKSDLELARSLNFVGSGVSNWRKGKALPSEKSIVDLAKLAGIDPAIALIDLATWRTEGETRQTYASILQKIQAVFLIGTVFFAFAPSPATAKVSNDKTVYVYYGNYRKFIKYISKVLQSFKNCALGLSNRYEREYLKA